MKIKFLISFVLVCFNLMAFASECPTCFGPEAKTQLMKEVSAKAKTLNYIIEKNVLYKKSGRTKVQIGNFQIQEARYLFEWQDKESQDYWVDGAGVTHADMNYVLKSDAQVYGRGFYVSLHPTDSMSFGTHMTVFEITKPMLLLEFQSAKQITDDEQELKELRSLGVAGILCTRPTWLSLINEKYLNSAKRLNAALLKEISNPVNKVPAFDSQLLLSAESLKKLAK